MMALLRALLVRKFKGAISSSTMGALGVLAGVAAWLQAHPAAVMAVAGSGWGPALLAGGALITAIARARTL